MKVTLKSRRLMLLQNLLFVVLFLGAIGLVGWLSTQYNYHADWTENGRNTLSETSVALLGEISQPVVITIFVRETPMLRKHISELVARYQRYKADIELKFVNPDADPQRVREMNITTEGEMVIESGGQQARTKHISEEGISNALQKVLRGGERKIAFLQGHGERDFLGAATYDLATWAQQLQAKGAQLYGLNLASEAVVPANTSLLVIAGPQADLLPAELVAIQGYLDRGGNLLWLVDPGKLFGLSGIGKQMGVEFLSGTIIDPNVSQVGMQLFGTDDPRMVLVASYGAHPVVSDFDFNTLFPMARGIEISDAGEWQPVTLLKTLSNVWAENGEIAGSIGFDAGDIAGPLNLGVALSREGDDAQQRVVVIGDGDFLSNGYLGVGGNLQLAMNIANWLVNDDTLLSIPAQSSSDITLDMDEFELAMVGLAFLVALPLLLLGSGFFIWWRRRRR
ncbi:MAG: GldG family protein [Gammaproteobacteria bacterium]|nr:GldG family protein [Gammaproteobacteria bacterium]